VREKTDKEERKRKRGRQQTGEKGREGEREGGERGRNVILIARKVVKKISSAKEKNIFTREKLWGGGRGEKGGRETVVYVLTTRTERGRGRGRERDRGREGKREREKREMG
jgi:hypothetical protein